MKNEEQERLWIVLNTLYFILALYFWEFSFKAILKRSIRILKPSIYILLMIIIFFLNYEDNVVKMFIFLKNFFVYFIIYLSKKTF